jgi:hypothetical protein
MSGFILARLDWETFDKENVPKMKNLITQYPLSVHSVRGQSDDAQ